MSTTASSNASAISLTGLGGFDSSGLVTQLVAIAEQPINALQTKQSNINSAVSDLNTYVSALSGLKSAATAMADPVGYNSYSATSSDSSIATTTTTGAVPGSYTVNVTSLASNEKLRSNSESASDSALGISGTLNIQVGTSGTSANLNIASTDTLTDIAAKISQSGARVSASVLYDGTNYRLAIQGLDTGAANAVNITQSGFDLGLQDSANVYQTASDAQLTVDGLAVTRPSNSISGVIPGVTMALTKPGVSSTVNVATNDTSLKTKISTFVTAYNEVVAETHTDTGYGSTAAANPVLQGDYTMRSAVDSLASLIGNNVPGSAGKYTTMGSVGLNLGADGTITFDSTAFDTAVSADPTGVSKLFVTDSTTGSTGVMKTLSDSINNMMGDSASPFSTEIASMQQQSRDLTTEMASKQTDVNTYQTQLKAQFANLDVIMSKYSSMASALTSITSSSG